MKKYFNLKNSALLALSIFIIMQFFTIDKKVPETASQSDFLTSTSANAEISGIIKSSCYDCHSNQSTYPWYSNVAPLSWWVKHHINEGRDELNFSVWETFTQKRKNHKLEECIEMIEEGEMPLASYTLMHKEAKLTDAQKLLLVDFFKALKSELNYVESN